MEKLSRLTSRAEEEVLDIMADESDHTIDDLVEKCLKRPWAQDANDPGLVGAAVFRVLEIYQSGSHPNVTSVERGGDVFYRLD